MGELRQSGEEPALQRIGRCYGAAPRQGVGIRQVGEKRVVSRGMNTRNLALALTSAGLAVGVLGSGVLSADAQIDPGPITDPVTGGVNKVLPPGTPTVPSVPP